MALQRPCIILSRRRTGAGSLYKLLAQHVPWVRMGSEPFFWSRAMGEVSRRFHTQASVGESASGHPNARELLLSELSRGVFFKHQYETESPEFNSFLLQSLAACRYRVLRFEREDEAERLFSMVVASHFSVWAREGMDQLRERLRRREPTPPVNLDEVRKLVREEQRHRLAFEAEYSRHDIETMSLSYEGFFRQGVLALRQADELFAFAGIGSRGSVLDDASLLRFVFSGEHYTLGLMAYSDDLREVHRVIVETLAQPPLASVPNKPLHLVPSPPAG